MFDAQQFGHSIGKFFKKIDRTLSFLPEKQRKVVVSAAALAASPVLASVVIAKGESAVDYQDMKDGFKDLVRFFCKIQPDTKSEEGDWEFGMDGDGYYVDGVKVYDLDYTVHDDNN